MAKRRTNHPGPDFYKVQGGHVEDRDVTTLSKQALVREAARRKRAGARPVGPAPKRKRAARPAAKEPIVVPESLSRANDREIGREIGREFARMNERGPRKQVKRAAPVRDSDYPTYLGATARGVIRRVARLALAPFVLARAVVERIRHHD
jgi:hypothetical protein